MTKSKYVYDSLLRILTLITISTRRRSFPYCGPESPPPPPPETSSSIQCSRDNSESARHSPKTPNLINVLNLNLFVRTATVVPGDGLSRSGKKGRQCGVTSSLTKMHYTTTSHDTVCGMPAAFHPVLKVKCQTDDYTGVN